MGFSGLRPTCSPQEHGFSSLWTVQVTPITRAKANCREGSDEDGGEEGRGESQASLFTTLLPSSHHSLLTWTHKRWATHHGRNHCGCSSCSGLQSLLDLLDGGWGEESDSVPPSCLAGSPGNQGFCSLHCVAISQTLGLS